MGATATEIFVLYLKHERLVIDYTYLAAVALWFYDYILTINREIKLVWLSPWNYSKILFLLARYIPVIGICLTLRNKIFLDLSVNSCVVGYPLSNWLFVAGFTCAEAIILIRTWALWLRDWRVGLFYGVTLVTSTVLASINIQQFLAFSIYRPPPYPGFRGCFVTRNSKPPSVALLTIVVIDALVLAGAAISAFRGYMAGNNGRLTITIHKDAILFNTYLLITSTASMTVAFALPAELVTTLCPFQVAFHSVFASRILFNLREAARRVAEGTNLGIHSDHPDVGTPSIVFRARDQLDSDSELGQGWDDVSTSY